MIDLVIESEHGRGRAFLGQCAAFVTGSGLVDDVGDGGHIRPLWACFPGTEQALRPFVTNLRLGRVARRSSEKDEPENRISFLRSARYSTDWQREPEGVVATMYHPELFKLDPGMIDPAGVRFSVLVPEDWASANEHPPAWREAIGHVAKMIASRQRALISLLAAELAEGRNAIVFAWHTNLLPRLKRLIELLVPGAHGRTVLLEPGKVPTAKREAWIDKHVVDKGARVLVVNPTVVQTGLNNLVHFSTEVFYENPACNPTIERQAVGRIDRLGQRLPTRVYFLAYRATLQQRMHELMLRKVAIATAADGLDAESVLIAAGGAEDAYLAGLSLGRQLYAMLERQQEATPRRRLKRSEAGNRAMVRA